jgi:hypothetical protein
MEVSEARTVADHFIPFAGGVTALGGKLLAINPASVAAIYSAWSKEHKEYELILSLNNTRLIKIRESDAAAALEELGLPELAENWILNLAEDL